MKSLFFLYTAIILSFSSYSQAVIIPIPDSSLENSDYDRSKAFYRLYKKNTLQISTLRSDSLQLNVFGKSNQMLTDPVTIGLTFFALQGILKDLEKTARTVSGDIAAHLINLFATGNAVAAHWESRLGDRLDRTIEQLKEAERRFVEDTEDLIRLIQQTIKQAQVGTIEVAIVTAGEADILAYNITSIIKRNKEARFVYKIPQSLRIGLNEPIVKVRGNFLGFKSYNFKITGVANEITPLAFSANEVILRLPDELLNSIKEETTISLTAEPYSRRKRLLWFGYKYWRENPQTQTVILKPKIDYTIAVIITAQAKVPTNNTFKYDFYDSDENCNADRRIDRFYVLPPTWYLSNLTQQPDISINTANCGSWLVGRGAYNSGDNGVVVEARIKGCGYSGPFNTFCKGRGWFGYTLRIPSKSYQFRPIPPFEQTLSVPNQSQRSFTFDYLLENIPPDNQGVKYGYTIVIQVQEGNTTHRVEISDVNPNVEGFRTRMDGNRLTLEIDPMLKIKEFK